MALSSLLKRILKKPRHGATPETDDKQVVKRFKRRYARFRKLLEANAALADLMAGMKEHLEGKSLFSMAYVKSASRQAVDLTRKMAQSLEGMSGRHAALLSAVSRIEGELHALLGTVASTSPPRPELTLPFSAINLGMVDIVGGKSANLGEMMSAAGVPVPRGFAVTVTAFDRFFAHEGLGDTVQKVLAHLEPDNREAFSRDLADLRALVEQAPLPEELEATFDRALDEAFGGDAVRLAVRSSAQAEDGSKSFAGQFLTELNIARADFSAAYKRVVASLFTPSATLYRLHQGIPLASSAMGVACLEMVNAVASGVAYSHDPVNMMRETMIINSVWGLGRYAVDGLVEPDLWVYSREEKPELVRRRAGLKDRKLVITPLGELADETIAEDAQRAFSLTDEEADRLAYMVYRLDEHYGDYQDIEWVRPPSGGFVFLQSRPLDTRKGGSTLKPPLIEGRTLLLEGGDIAFPGVGYGPVFMPTTPEDLLAFPQGGVLVATHSSAEYAAVMDKAQAVITQTGGLTGHMATISREFKVPTILNAPHVMQTLKPGMPVTVDAFSCRVYEGAVEELFPLRLTLDSVRLKGTPVYEALSEAARLILPLNLIDPSSSRFSTENCETLHDVMRYAHELSYHEMFAISDSATQAGSVAMKLKAPLPIDLHIIDLDSGTTASTGTKYVTPEEIISAPLKALLNGMLLPEVVFRRPRPVNMGGFLSVMSQQMANPQGGDARFGDKSYAIISDRYMNFSSRVGYHYSVLDAYCGMTESKNYIAFSFQGGAAGEVRRIRRIKAIALVLEELDFTVQVQGDMVKARLKKYEKPEIEIRLDQLGRLLQVTRQMDMLMVSDEAVTRFRDDFMSGIYR